MGNSENKPQINRLQIVSNISGGLAAGAILTTCYNHRPMDDARFSRGVQFLADAGLNLCAVLDCAALPAGVATTMTAAGIPLAGYSRLVLTGHGGGRFWEKLKEFGWHTADPVDHYSLVVMQQFIDDYLKAPPVLLIYPAEYLLPLQQLGELAGWSQPSPLGLGINPEYGLWFAYRTAFLTNYQLPVTQSPASQSPCATCADKPCINTCPAGAVQSPGRFDVYACATFRLATDSACADRCLARTACPIGAEHRYTLEQVQYHYRYSLTEIREYYLK